MKDEPAPDAGAFKREIMDRTRNMMRTLADLREAVDLDDDSATAVLGYCDDLETAAHNIGAVASHLPSISQPPASSTAQEDYRQKLRMVISHASGGHLSDEADVERLKQRLESAEDALRPFAMALHEWGDDAGQPDRWNVWEHPIANGVTLGDFRSAAHFLQEQEKQNG